MGIASEIGSKQQVIIKGWKHTDLGYAMVNHLVNCCLQQLGR